MNCWFLIQNTKMNVWQKQAGKKFIIFTKVQLHAETSPLVVI